MGSEALNLEAIDLALRQHDANCGNPVTEIRMAPFEVERLDWETYKGIPIIADDTMPTGRFRIVCAEEGRRHAARETEAVAV
jgi:hypothetical protein